MLPPFASEPNRSAATQRGTRLRLTQPSEYGVLDGGSMRNVEPLDLSIKHGLPPKDVVNEYDHENCVKRNQGNRRQTGHSAVLRAMQERPIIRNSRILSRHSPRRRRIQRLGHSGTRRIL